jgi:hypothetical protein
MRCTDAEYRRYAQECMDSARVAASDATRVQFLELAQLWLSMATRLELRKADGKAIWSNGGHPSGEAEAEASE